jgi:hypothetical protein
VYTGKVQLQYRYVQVGAHKGVRTVPGTHVPYQGTGVNDPEAVRIEKVAHG